MPMFGCNIKISQVDQALGHHSCHGEVARRKTGYFFANLSNDDEAAPGLIQELRKKGARLFLARRGQCAVVRLIRAKEGKDSTEA